MPTRKTTSRKTKPGASSKSTPVTKAKQTPASKAQRGTSSKASVATESAICIPHTGKASTYAYNLDGRPTTSGETYQRKLFTAAILPRARWNCVPMGTRVEITHGSRKCVVKINDKGAGDGTLSRALDLSNAAMAYLTGHPIHSQKDALAAGIINLSQIKIVSRSTSLRPH